VGFTPSVAGPEGAVVSFTDNAPGSPQALELVGVGEGLLASPGNLNFGKVAVGETDSGSITFTNTTLSGIENISFSTIMGPNAAEFQPSPDSSNCVPTLAAGNSCQLTYIFKPNAPGPFQAAVEINYEIEAAGAPAPMETVSFTGIGTSAVPAAGVAPVTLAFGSMPVGTVSGTQTVTLTNQGSAQLNLSGITITGPNAGDFAIVPAGTACPMGSGSLGFGNPPPFCTVSVEFAPQSGDAAGVKSASLNFSDNASGSPQMVSLGGTATVPPPTLQVSPAMLAFGTESEGAASMPQTVTITNPAGGIAADISEISITGANKSDFVLDDPCAPVLGVGSSCKVSVSFSPAISEPSGMRTATLNVPGGSPAQVPLSGSTVVAGISIAPSSSSINFGSAVAGAGVAAGTPVTLTVTNNGSGGLTFSGVSIGGANAGDFVLGEDSCTASSTGPAGTCTIQVTFAPDCVNVPAARTAVLTLVDNAPGSPQTIALGGTATGEFCVDPPPSSSMTQTVTQGETGVFPLNLLSPSGAQATISIACTVSSSDVPCTLALTATGTPTSCTPVLTAVTLPANFVACLQTTAPSSSLLPKWPEKRGPLDSPFPLAAVLALMALMAAGAAGSLSRMRPRRLARLAQGAALLLLLGAGVVACGSAGGTSGNPGTPLGSYTATVTATATDGTTKTIILTLNVTAAN
jgi:hypothetical protein